MSNNFLETKITYSIIACNNMYHISVPHPTFQGILSGFLVKLNTSHLRRKKIMYFPHSVSPNSVALNLHLEILVAMTITRAEKSELSWCTQAINSNSRRGNLRQRNKRPWFFERNCEFCKRHWNHNRNVRREWIDCQILWKELWIM